GSQNNDTKRQFLLERLLDAVKQCQIRFGGRKEIASDSDSRVTCLCAQFEAVLQHGLKRSRGLALTAAALKQAAGFASKTETDEETVRNGLLWMGTLKCSASPENILCPSPPPHLQEQLLPDPACGCRPQIPESF
uniref:Sorting nexin 29 n=1 Tax=Equus caballus TaxID=9796 RepID=A0A9L0SXD6_HORSE